MRAPRRGRASVILPILLALSGACDMASAQLAPVFVEPGHWSLEAVRRLSVAGVAPVGADPAFTTMNRILVRSIFERAALKAEQTGSDELARLARGYIGLLDAEADTTGVLSRAGLRAGLITAMGEALAGQGQFVGEDWEGARPLADMTGAVIAFDGAGWVRPWLSWGFDAGLIGDDWRLAALTLAASYGRADVWVGRRRLHYGVGHGGGTVAGNGVNSIPDLSTRTIAAFDGAGLQLRDLWRFQVEVQAGRLARNGNIENPYIAFGRLTLPVGPRVALVVNRGAIFGGDGNPVTLARLGGLILGLHGGEGGEFENQVFSGAARVRPPLGGLPLELYAELGMDDTAGAFRDAPGIIAGVDIGPIPGARALSLGLEHTRFTRSCCGNPMWYRNVFFRGSWSDEGRLFAHPLAGHGDEWLLHARFDQPERGVLLRVEAFTRRRGDENLFAPERTGGSWGGFAGVEYRAGRATALRFDAATERGAAHVTRATFTLSYNFRSRSVDTPQP